MRDRRALLIARLGIVAWLLVVVGMLVLWFGHVSPGSLFAASILFGTGLVVATVGCVIPGGES